MSRLLVSIIFSLMICVAGQAQPQVVLLRDTTRLHISLAELVKTYPPAFAREAGQTGVFARQGNAFNDTTNRSYQQFTEYHTKLPKYQSLLRSGVRIQMEQFVRPDGSYAWVFCTFDASGLTDAKEQALLILVADWYNAHPFPLRTKTGFHWNTIISLGNYSGPRKPRTGRGTIATLEAARQTTRPDTVTHLFFNQLELTTIPEEVYRFPNLTQLDLSKNAIRQLPARLTTDLPRLQQLSVLYNQLTDDSIAFARNKHVKALNLQGNNLTRIPASTRQNRRLTSFWMGNNPLKTFDRNPFKGLRHLTDLNLYNAGLVSLPDRISRLRHLNVLDLYYNKLTELPKSIGRLRRLEQLALAHNQLKQLPESIGRLKNLQTLYAHHNQLSNLPESLPGLVRLRILDVGYNWFSTVPLSVSKLQSLEEMDLSGNNLQELPAALTQLTQLKKLYLRQNPVVRPANATVSVTNVISRLEANQTEVFH